MALDLSILDDGVKLAKLTGRLDMQAINDIGDQFAFSVGNSKGSAIVDLSEVTFLASIGMRMLISAARSLSNRGHKMILLSPIPEVKDALVMVGFDELIPICDDMDAALALTQKPVA
ncbi:anti-sigma factor antagonist [filamentous cyanobacterium CCP4]|nr:anti-sigma factor antagonist [filamentous cyanobacterium CCP4]